MKSQVDQEPLLPAQQAVKEETSVVSSNQSTHQIALTLPCAKPIDMEISIKLCGTDERSPSQKQSIQNFINKLPAQI